MSVEADAEWTSDAWRGNDYWRSSNSGSWSSNGWSDRWNRWDWNHWDRWDRWSPWNSWSSWSWSSPSWDSRDYWRGWRQEPSWTNWDWRNSSQDAWKWKDSGEESQGQWYKSWDEEPESSKEPPTPSCQIQERAEDAYSVRDVNSLPRREVPLKPVVPEVTRASSSEELQRPEGEAEDPWRRYQVEKELKDRPEIEAEVERPVPRVVPPVQAVQRSASSGQPRERSRPPALRPHRDLQSKIFVSGLCGDTLPQTLGEFCQSVGEVRYATVYMDPDSGSSNGTGKVDFDCQETAERAIRDLNGSTLDGVQITVQSLADVPLHYWQRRDTGRAIFVGNLDPSVTKDELQAFASRVGEVVFTRIFTDRQTGHSRGCGKVEYASVEQAEEAINKLNGKALGGQAVTVEPMASERRPPVPKPQSTVFVGGLAPEMDEGALLELASRIGPVSFARIFRDRDSGRSRNCGKIEFETEDLALQALTQLAGVDFHGRKISVQPFGQASENPELSRPQVDGRQVFFAGLTPDTNSAMLREFCQMTVGAVDTARVFINRETGESKRTAKVEFETAELAQKSVQELNGCLLDGHRMSVRLMERLPRDTADNCRLFVGNLPEEVTEEQLKDLLGQAGEVLSASIIRTPHSICSGRVVMACADEASRAVTVLHDTFFISNRITVRVDAGKPQLDSTVFVGGLNFDTTSEGLQQHFAQVGEVIYAAIFTVRGTGKPRGSGKVEYQTPEAAQLAVQKLDGSELDGRQLHVKPMEAKPPQTPRPPPGLRPPDSSRQLFVSLSTETSTEMLREFCESCLGDGAVAYCSILRDKETGEPKGSAKLELTSPELVDRALKELEGAMLQGSPLSFRRPGEKLPQEPDGRTVFMGGLSWDLDSEGLKAFAGQVGEVVYAAVFTNRETGKSKGSGKVQFVNGELALKAVEELNGRELLGREVSVRMMEAQPRKPG